jgi:hypothetical protein
METPQPEQFADIVEPELTMAQLQLMNIQGLQLRVNNLQGFMDAALEPLTDDDKRTLPNLEDEARKAELAHQWASKSALTGGEKDDRDKLAKDAAKALHALGEFIRGDEKRLKAYQQRRPLRFQLEISENRIARLQAMNSSKSSSKR